MSKYDVVSIVLITHLYYSGPIYKKHLTFFIHCINDVFGPYFRLDTSIIQWI